MMTNDADAAEAHMSGKMTETEFTKRFTARCLEMSGLTHFDDGMSVEEYCSEVAKSYYQDPQYREDGPELCADSDMSYWGED